MKHLYALLLWSATLTAQAQSGGTLRGQITDKNTGEALIGASVQVVGTYAGAAADLDGRYLIEGIKPGDYSVKITYLGYNEQLYTGIRIAAGETTELNAALDELGQTLETVTIIGERNLVDLEAAKSEYTVRAEEIAEMNVQDVQGIAELQVGVNKTPDGLQIRGGRVYETQYLVEGISAQDPLAGTGFGVDVGANAVQELKVITGASDAEYGTSTSGVIATKIKEGTETFQASGSWQRDNLGFNPNSGPSWNTDIADLAFGGPIPFTKKKATFFVGGSVFLSDDYYRIFADQLRSSILPDQTAFSPRQNNRFTNSIKLSYNVKPGTKITVSNQHSIAVNQNTRTLQIVGFDAIVQPGLQFRFAEQPDNATTYTHRSNLTTVNARHFFAERWSVDVALGRLFTNLRADANGRPFRPETIDQLFDPRSIVTDPVDVFNPESDVVFVFPGNGFVNNGGISTLWHDHYAEEYTVKTKFSLALKNSYLTFGQEHQFQHYQWVDVTSPWVGAPIRIDDGTFTPSISIGSSNDIWEVRPQQGGIFVQDEIRYKGIIATFGLRFNYWAPGRFADDAVADPAAPVTDATRAAYEEQTAQLFGLRWKARLLPKLRVSFPVTENMVLYFNYGHAMRLPHPRFVYAGLDPVYQDRSFLSNLGNPNLNPEVTVAYEMGIKTQITRDFALTTTAFYSDRFDYIVNRTAVVRDQTGRFTQRTFSINQDYARIYGVETTLSYRLARWLNANFSVAYQQAKGKSNTAAESLLQIRTTGFVNTTQEQFLAWDRPWDLKGFLILKTLDEWRVGSVPLNNIRVFLSSTLKSGLRYTPFEQVGVEPNGRPRYEEIIDQPLSEVGTPWFYTDLKVSRDFTVAKKAAMSLSFEVRNLFNNLNAQIINPVTGDAYETGDPLPINRRDPAFPNPQETGLPPDNPARYLPPRQVFFGLSFRI